MIPIAKPVIGEEEIAKVIEVLRSGMIVQGDKVAEFEKEVFNLYWFQARNSRVERYCST